MQCFENFGGGRVPQIPPPPLAARLPVSELDFPCLAKRTLALDQSENPSIYSATLKAGKKLVTKANCQIFPAKHTSHFLCITSPLGNNLCCRKQF